MSQTITDSVCLSPTVCFCHSSPVFFKESVCLSQQVFFVCHFVPLSNTLIDHFCHDFFLLFKHDFHQDLSVKFVFVRYFNPTRTNFMDPCLPWWSIFGSIIRTNFSLGIQSCCLCSWETRCYHKLQELFINLANYLLLIQTKATSQVLNKQGTGWSE